MSWHKGSRQWRASIKHSGESHSLGQFDDEHEAARAYDAAARRLRVAGEAHGGKSGTNWQRLNIPTAEEEAYAARQGMPAGSVSTGKVYEQVKSNDPDNDVQSGPGASGGGSGPAASFKLDYLGVSWDKQSSQWVAKIKHKGETHGLGQYDDEQEAGRAYDTAARRLRPNGEAHGGKTGTDWVRLNFATVEEEAYAAQQGMPAAGSAAGMQSPKKKRKA